MNQGMKRVANFHFCHPLFLDFHEFPSSKLSLESSKLDAHWEPLFVLIQLMNCLSGAIINLFYFENIFGNNWFFTHNLRPNSWKVILEMNHTTKDEWCSLKKDAPYLEPERPPHSMTQKSWGPHSSFFLKHNKSENLKRTSLLPILQSLCKADFFGK